MVLFFKFTHACFISSKTEKKPIVLLSSLHICAEVFDDDKELPCLAHGLNQLEYGVNIIDQRLGCILFEELVADGR